jgi:N-acetylneuraminate synthase
MRIGERIVGEGAPTYVVAELSANHGQSLDRAIEIVRAAAAAGADAVKLQTYTPDTITIDSDAEYFRIAAGTAWDGKLLYHLYAEAYTPWEWHAPLRDEASRLGLDLFSAPFDETAVDFLEELGVPVYKIASPEIIDVGLIRRAAETGKPLIISTGMATLDEIEEALEVARSGGATDIALLKCTSAYPAPPEEANVSTIPNMAERFDVPVGLSDHTIGTAVPIAAVALGAAIVEKHLTLSRDEPGPDSGFSTEPAEFAAMVAGIREAELAVGQVSYEPTGAEVDSRILRRSLFIVRDMVAGEAFSAENVRSIRPGHGLHTRHLREVLGRPVTRDVSRGTPLSWDLVGS